MKIILEIEYNSFEGSMVRQIDAIKQVTSAKVIDIQTKECKKKYTSEYFKKAVFRHYKIPVEMAESNSRKRELVEARQVAMFFSKNYTSESWASIGKNIGDKDHATAMHSHKAVNNMIDTDKKFKAKIDKLEKILI